MQRTLDTLALLGLSAVLLVAFYYQFALGELPCPLCALQRVGFVVAGVALMLNLRNGYAPAHYGIVLLTSVAAASASLRQIALHVVPGSGSYGSALFGWHFYTWAFVGYGALVVYVGAMLLLVPAAQAGDRTPRLGFVREARVRAAGGDGRGERRGLPARMRTRPVPGQPRRLPLVAGAALISGRRAPAACCASGPSWSRCRAAGPRARAGRARP